MQKKRSIASLTIESSLLCHNFINTVYAWRGENLHEYFGTYQDVMEWCRKLKVLDEAEITSLSLEAAEAPARAEKALERMKAVRALMFKLVSGIAQEDTVFAPLLSELNPLMAASVAKSSIQFRQPGFEVVFKADPGDFEAPLWPVLYSLRQMLLFEENSRIKECPACGWVFLDQTRNGSRKWCSVTECGTKDKMIRYNRKRKLAGK